MSLPLELPEIETVRRDLDREIGGKKVKSVDVSSSAVIETLIALLMLSKSNSLIDLSNFN